MGYGMNIFFCKKQKKTKKKQNKKQNLSKAPRKGGIAVPTLCEWAVVNEFVQVGPSIVFLRETWRDGKGLDIVFFFFFFFFFFNYYYYYCYSYFF